MATTKVRSPKSTQTNEQAFVGSVAPVPAAASSPAPVPGVTANQPTLVAVGGKAPRAGTAAAATYAALMASIGQPRATVLEVLKETETGWHAANGRTVKSVAPSGWLRTHKAEFA